MSDKIDQRVDGSGNAFSGSGPVTVNNITKNYYPPEKPSSTTSPFSELAPLFGVPNLPPRYLERDDYLDQFRKALLSGETQAIGITGRPQYVGVQGMGGLGKSVLAAALAWDEQVRRAFPDGIFWLRFGQEVDEAGVLELQKEILLVLAPDSQPESPAQGQNLLNLALRDKRCLIIADDLWDSRHINHFDLADSGSRFLLTTRNNEVIQETGAHRCELELLSDEQARELLAKSSGFAEEDLPEEAEAILRECGRLPLAVAAIGSMVNGKGRSRWQLALDKLQNARLDKIPAKFDRYSGYENLFKVFQVSVEDLPPEVQDYFKTLIVFPEDTEIPESVLQLYWEHIGQGEYEPLEAVDLLVQRSLLTPGANHNAFVLHDLLRDYLVFQADGKVAGLHKKLLEAYKEKYSGGWQEIPVEKPYYFHRYWHIHAQESGETAQTSCIADDLIRQQPCLSLPQARIGLEFVDYEFKDIAWRLVKESRDQDLLIACLKILGDEAKDNAPRLLKESQNSKVLTACLNILGNEAKEDAQRLLKESRDQDLLIACLKILGNEAKEDARRLLKESQVPDVLSACLKILGNDAKEVARRLLKESKSTEVIKACLHMLNDEAKEDARRLLKESQVPDVLTASLNILGNEAKEDARRLLKESQVPDVLSACLKILGNDAKEVARRLLKESKSTEVIKACLHMLNDEAKEDARRLLKESQVPDVLTASLNILGNEAKEDARRLLKESQHPHVLAACLNILGNEAKEDAWRFLKESKSSAVIKTCLYILNDEAKEDARRLLTEGNNEEVIVGCIRILGKETKVEAERLIKTSKSRFVRKACRELIRSWETSIGSQFPELARLKKNLENK